MLEVANERGGTMPFEMNRGPRVSDSVRNVCRVLGPLCLIVAVGLIAVSFVSFFQYASRDTREVLNQMLQTGRPVGPRYFWCFFVAVPIFLLGGIMTNIGYMGLAGRYVARELAPAGREIVNAVLGDREIHLDAAHARARTCPKCAGENDADARFCKQCGEALSAALVCPACGKLGDPDAQFCSHCGEAMT